MTVAIQEKQTVTFRTLTANTRSIDDIAQYYDRDRTYILNQAIMSYLEIYNWQVEHIKEGVSQANDNNFVEESEWKSAFKL